MIDLILLAAGASRRFGSQKLLADFHGKPLYRYAFDAARHAANEMLGLRVTVVTRSNVLDEPIREYGFNKIIVPDGRPLSESVAAGSKAARSGSCRCFMVCDQPGFTGEMLSGFLKGYILSGRPLGRVRSGEQMGTPCVFAPYLLPQLLSLQGDEGGRSLFQGRENRTFFYDVPADALKDYDTPWNRDGASED